MLRLIIMDSSHSGKEIRIIIIRAAFMLSIAIRTTTAVLEKFPHDLNATVGQNVTLPCKTSLDYTVFWYFNGEEIFYGGKVSMSSKDKFRVESHTKGEYNLIISPADESYTGVYECGDDEGQGEKRSARLYVTGLVATTAAAVSAELTGSGNELKIIIPIVVFVVIGIIVGVLVCLCCRKRIENCDCCKSDSERGSAAVEQKNEKKPEKNDGNGRTPPTKKETKQSQPEVGWTTESTGGKVDATNNIGVGGNTQDSGEMIDTGNNIGVKDGIDKFNQMSSIMRSPESVAIVNTSVRAPQHSRPKYKPGGNYGDQKYSRSEVQLEEEHALLNSPEERGGAEQDASITTPSYLGATTDDSVVGYSADDAKCGVSSVTPRYEHKEEVDSPAIAEKEKEQNITPVKSSNHTSDDPGADTCNSDTNSPGDGTEEIQPSNNDGNHSGNSVR